jgi:hypothetical protein
MKYNLHELSENSLWKENVEIAESETCARCCFNKQIEIYDTVEVTQRA